MQDLLRYADARNVILLFGILLAHATLGTHSRGILRREYEMSAKISRYYNPGQTTHDNAWCDIFTDCDPRFRIVVECEFCSTSGAVFYPDAKSSYDNTRELGENFTQNLEEVKVFFSNKLTHVIVNLLVEDVDIWLHDVIWNVSIPIDAEDMQPHSRKKRSLKPTDSLFIDLEWSIKCKNSTCTSECIQIVNKKARCENGLLNCLATPQLGCNVVSGRFALSFYLISYNATDTMEADAKCTNEMTVLVIDSTTGNKTGKWKMLFRTKKGYLGNIIESDDREYFDYYITSSRITYPNVTVLIRVGSNCSAQNESVEVFSTVRAEVGTYYLQSPLSFMQHFSGYFEISCQDGYDGLHCQKSCPNCTTVNSWQCNDMKGPSCAYRKLCALDPCHNGATCIVTRETRDVYKAQCLCRLGFTGSLCELYDGQICTQKNSCHGRGNCTDSYITELRTWTSNCTCEAGYDGPQCSVCRAPSRVSGCKTLVGNYAVLVELLSVTNAHGWLNNNTHCDDGRSRCDLLVYACLDITYCKHILIAPNTDVFERSKLRADMFYTYLEDDYTWLNKPETSIQLSLTLYEFGNNAWSENTFIAEFYHTFEFAFTPVTPQKFNVTFEDADLDIRSEVAVTLRCARGFTGVGCYTACNASNSDSPYLDVAESVDSLDSCSFPRHLLCKTGLVDPICDGHNLCANVTCPDKTTCTKASDSAEVRCESVLDACESGAETCSRHGTCLISESEQITCSCDEGYGGSFCEFDAWCSIDSQALCHSVVTCKPKQGEVFSCNCEFNGSYCNTDSPCALLDCQPEAVCIFDKELIQALCYCNGLLSFGGTCDNGANASEAQITLKTSTLLFGSILMLSMLVVGFICYLKRKNEKKIKAAALQSTVPSTNCMQSAVNAKREESMYGTAITMTQGDLVKDEAIAGSASITEENAFKGSKSLRCTSKVIVQSSDHKSSE